MPGSTFGGEIVHNYRLRSVLAVIGVFLLLPQMSLAAQHLWDISEIYSNADGSVQFIELSTNANGQHLLNSHRIIAISDGNETNFVIPGNAPSSNTGNHR